MDHGSRAYFKEKVRSARRVSRICVALGFAMLGGVLAPMLPPVHRALEKVTEQVPILRYGFEGPTRIVELVEYDAIPGENALRSVGAVTPTAPSRGRGSGESKPAPEGGEGATGGTPSGVADEPDDLVRRALSGESGLPVFQSDDLILDHLVRPVYPEQAQALGSEGRVGVLALVDTLGNVKETALISKSGDVLLDRAAIDAVRQCRFRPYQENGVTTEVYAVFRFVFRIY